MTSGPLVRAECQTRVPDRSRDIDLAADDEDGAPGALGHSLRGAAEDEASQAAAAVGSQHDDVGRLCSRCLEHGFSWITFPDEERRPRAGTTRSHDELVGLLFDPGSFLINSPQEVAAGQAQAVRVDDAQDNQLGAMFDGEPNRVLGGLRRNRRKIGRQEDTLDRAGLFHDLMIGRGPAPGE